MGRLIIVSNRLPLTVVKRRDGLRFHPSAGGLATGLASFYRQGNGLWVGWPGIGAEKLTQDERRHVQERLLDERCVPIFLSEPEVEAYYLGFSNRTLWPLFHYFTQYTVYERSLWEAYRRVNERFAEVLEELAHPDDTIWVHDYQLMLLPGLLRRRLPRAAIGFFLHIPFPAFEVFRALPWRQEIVEGLLGADLIGFHTYDYALHFLDCAHRLAGADQRLGYLTVDHRLVRVDAFPMGIDYDRFAGAASSPEVQREVRRLREHLQGRKMVLSVSRLDYSKGIPQRLAAFDLFLEQHPEYREKVTLVVVAVPSRTEVPAYQALKRQIDERISEINGKHGTLHWMPVWYLYRALPFAALAALYQMADVALVTPLRDGMNLIAKEFVSSKADGGGVLILSEMAGASKELTEALVVNPHNVEEVASALYRALTMPAEEQVARNRAMQQRLRQFTVNRWAGEFVEQLRQVRSLQEDLATRVMTPDHRARLVEDYRRASRRLLLLDYDGTLTPFAERPERALPDAELLGLLQKLCDDPANTVVVVSGRDRHSLERWFGHLKVGLVAEHGVWLKVAGGDWELAERLQTDWKESIRPIMESYAAITPGAFVEEKAFSLVWHYRRADPMLAELRSRELKNALTQLTAPLDLGVLEGDRAIEVKNLRIHKGRAVTRWLEAPTADGKSPYDFVLAIGDDTTDEDMFAAVGPEDYTIKVRFGPTRARFYLESPAQVRELLSELSR